MAISPTSIGAVFTEPPNGTQRISEPTAWIAARVPRRSPAIVNSRSGSASSPPLIVRPEAPTE